MVSKARADGVSMATDTTRHEIIADPERVQETLAEWTRRRPVPATGFGARHISADVVNYFSLAIDAHLQGVMRALAAPVGGGEAVFHFSSPAQFDYALAVFAHSAELRYFAGWTQGDQGAGHIATHDFHEIYWPFRTDSMSWMQITVGYDPRGRLLTPHPPVFRARSAKRLFRLPGPLLVWEACPRTTLRE